MIKAIEPQSPAELSGLKPGDKILYVNNENVENLSYSNVIEKLKQALNVSDELNLVVMNAIEYNIFKGKNKSENKIYLKIECLFLNFKTNPEIL
jgi:C-terminal processing protease CtpA/Prc